MQIRISWTGIESQSEENCRILFSGDGIDVQSFISGIESEKKFTVNYRIRLTKNWEVISANINFVFGDTNAAYFLEKDKGGWKLNNVSMPQFNNCRYIDISFTPFTNSLPINRLNLGTNESQLIQVVYFDIEENEVREATQKHTRVGENQFKFENVPNDFEAVIDVDKNGLVEYYPGLFEKKSLVNK